MNVEQLLRNTLEEMSERETAPVPPDFADRVLRTRRRRRSQGGAAIALALVAVLGAALTVPAFDGGGKDGDVVGTETTEVTEENTLARPDQSPPRELVAAGDTALSAYVMRGSEDLPDGDVVRSRVWHLYDPDSGRYEKTDWAWADVAPGLEVAAVLEGPLPADRIGIVDLATGEVRKWIPLDHEAGSVFWSPAGDRILATTYGKNPDRLYAEHPVNDNGEQTPGPRPSRTGFSVVDPASGESTWTDLPYEKEEFGYFGSGRDDLRWSWDGSLVWAHNSSMPPKRFYDLRGRPAKSPTENRAYTDAGRSPDGRYAAGDFAGEGPKEIATVVFDARTGERVAKQPVQELLAWADEDTLIAWGCDPDKCTGKGEFRQQLVLVDVRGGQPRELTDFRDSQSADGWEPYFSRR